jgi:hypothetical protein
MACILTCTSVAPSHTCEIPLFCAHYALHLTQGSAFTECPTQAQFLLTPVLSPSTSWTLQTRPNLTLMSPSLGRESPTEGLPRNSALLPQAEQHCAQSFHRRHDDRQCCHQAWMGIWIEKGDESQVMSLHCAPDMPQKIISCWSCHCGHGQSPSFSHLLSPNLPGEGLGTLAWGRRGAPYSHQQLTWVQAPQGRVLVRHAFFT